MWMASLYNSNHQVLAFCFYQQEFALLYDAHTNKSRVSLMEQRKIWFRRENKRRIRDSFVFTGRTAYELAEHMQLPDGITTNNGLVV